jgi:hypothetical protein
MASLASQLSLLSLCVVLAGPVAVAVAAEGPAGAPWPARTVSWWYACDNNWPQALAYVQPYAPAMVTSVQTYCGWTVSDAGTIVGGTSSACVNFFAGARALGVRAELTLDAGNCSIAAYRTLWADTTASPAQLLNAALAANATGWNMWVTGCTF